VKVPGVFNHTFHFVHFQVTVVRLKETNRARQVEKRLGDLQRCQKLLGEEELKVSKKL